MVCFINRTVAASRQAGIFLLTEYFIATMTGQFIYKTS